VLSVSRCVSSEPLSSCGFCSVMPSSLAWPA
jgi:hypothetical protein